MLQRSMTGRITTTWSCLASMSLQGYGYSPLTDNDYLLFLEVS